MKKLIILMMILMIYSNTALAINALGPPIATLGKGQFAMGFDYSYTEVDFKIRGYGLSVDIHDAEFNAYLGKIGYGITYNWDIYGHCGFAGFEGEKFGIKFDDDTTFNIGFITKATIIEDEYLPWGLAFQANWIQEAEDKWTLGPYSGSTEFDIWELQIATGPTYKIGDLYIYGGPFLYWLRGDMEIQSSGMHYSFDLEEESIFGVFAGAQLDINENISINAEYQVTDDSYALGMGIAYKF